MPFKKKPNFDKIEKAIQLSLEKKLVRMGNGIIEDIKVRTRNSKDLNNRRFKPYSKLYKISKRKSHGSSKPNLTRTGKMLDAIRFIKIKNGIRLYFSSSWEREKAFKNQAKFGRKFFGLDRRLNSRISKKLNK